MGAFSLVVNPHQLSCYHNELIRLSIKGNTLFSEWKPCPLANKKYQNIFRNSDKDTDDVGGLQMFQTWTRNCFLVLSVLRLSGVKCF